MRFRSPVLVLAFAMSSTLGCGRGASDRTPPPPPVQNAAATTDDVSRVERVDDVSHVERVDDPSLVCMVNDTYMGRAQIPVEVEGKTYFGCCPACKERLANEPGVRAATDPVTGESVDKALAVIAQTQEGKVLYFASERTLRDYRGR